jgi:hypothetical protein
MKSLAYNETSMKSLAYYTDFWSQLLTAYLKTQWLSCYHRAFDCDRSKGGTQALFTRYISVTCILTFSIGLTFIRSADIKGILAQLVHLSLLRRITNVAF